MLVDATLLDVEGAADVDGRSLKCFFDFEEEEAEDDGISNIPKASAKLAPMVESMTISLVSRFRFFPSLSSLSLSFFDDFLTLS